jgi:hypothetical protein
MSLHSQDLLTRLTGKNNGVLVFEKQKTAKTLGRPKKKTRSVSSGDPCALATKNKIVSS